MIEICNALDCVGCGACLSSCSKDAISMKPDKLGFLYPEIDQTKCVDCGLCARSCFNNNRPAYKEPLYSCVGHASNIQEQISSTSGGLASVFVETILRQGGGVVYGCSGENAREVKHIRIEHVEEVVKLKGSKYVQSFLGSIYKNVANDLRHGKIVLFIGTPCQVAGLKAFIKGKNVENLFTVDFVCHGVPSQKILNDAIDSKTKSNESLTLVNRVKEGCKESKYTLRLLNGSRIVCDETYPSAGYITGFLRGLYYRENCYRCQFARRERVSDITLGDFWDRNNTVEGLPHKKEGLSMIIVNTESGKKLFSLSQDDFVHMQWNYDDFILRNGQLKQPIQRHPKRDVFASIYLTSGYERAMSVLLKSDLRVIRMNILLNSISAFINRIPVVRAMFKQLKRM